MEYEVNQAVGEGDEEEEEEVESSSKVVNFEDALENSLENYRSADIARLHLEIHNLASLQDRKIDSAKVSPVQFRVIDEYIGKLQRIIEKKNSIDKKAENIKKRFAKVAELMKKKIRK